MIKESGYSVSETLTLMIILPLMLFKTINEFYKIQHKKATEMKIMIKRATKNRFILRYALTDSWF